MLIDLLKQFWPLLALQLTLQVIALINLSRREKVRFNNKWFWVPIIMLGSILGIIAYFAFGGQAYEDGSED